MNWWKSAVGVEASIVIAVLLAAGCSGQPKAEASFESVCKGYDDYLVSEPCRRWFWNAHKELSHVDMKIERDAMGEFYYCPTAAALYENRHELRYRKFLDDSQGDGGVAVEKGQVDWHLAGFEPFRVAGELPLEAQRRALVSGEWIVTGDLVDVGLVMEVNHGDVKELARAIGWVRGWEFLAPGAEGVDPTIGQWIFPPERGSAAAHTELPAAAAGDRFFSAVYRDSKGAPVALSLTLHSDGSLRTEQRALKDLAECAMKPGQVYVGYCQGIAR